MFALSFRNFISRVCTPTSALSLFALQLQLPLAPEQRSSSATTTALCGFRTLQQKKNKVTVTSGTVARLCDALLAYNWTKTGKQQFLSDLQIGFLGTVSGLIGLAAALK